MRVRTPYELLAEHLRDNLDQVGLAPDKYDPDFILGVIIDWLADHDAVFDVDGIHHR